MCNLGISFSCKNALRFTSHKYAHTWKHTCLRALNHKHVWAGPLFPCVPLIQPSQHERHVTSLFVLHLSLFLSPSLISPSLHLSIITPLLGPPHLFDSIPVRLSLLILPPSLASATPPLCHYSLFFFFTRFSFIPSSPTSSFHLVPHFCPLQWRLSGNTGGPAFECNLART